MPAPFVCGQDTISWQPLIADAEFVLQSRRERLGQIGQLLFIAARVAGAVTDRQRETAPFGTTHLTLGGLTRRAAAVGNSAEVALGHCDPREETVLVVFGEQQAAEPVDLGGTGDGHVVPASSRIRMDSRSPSLLGAPTIDTFLPPTRG
ncbi:hypothetical protein [Rhodococcus opacus]|uniref:hypothetical protein n=1 Tax=Rhodococcus opacus TaxID=37919 RepID=UPI001F53E81A|nr:hypothetical protein [Rhodococcus opacus]